MTAWTLKKATKELSKYSKRSECKNKASYIFLKKNYPKELDILLPPRKKSKWSLKELRKEASKYSTRTDFRNSSGGYNTLLRNYPGEIDKLFTPVRKKWTLKEAKKLAGKYKTREDMKKESLANSCLNFLRKNHEDVLDKILPRTKRRGAWTIGEAKKELKKYKNRKDMDKKLVSFLIENCPEQYYSHFDSKKREKWTLANFKNVAKECANRKEFREKYGGGYCYMIKHHSEELDRALPLDITFIKDWTLKSALLEIKKYSEREEFRNKSVYRFLEEKYPKELERYFPKRKKWTKKSAISFLKKESKFLSRNKITSSNAYNFLRKKYPEELMKIVPPLKKYKWTKEEAIVEAKKYDSRTDFSKNVGAACAYLRSNYPEELNRLFPMRKKIKWTREEVLKEAKKIASSVQDRNDIPRKLYSVLLRLFPDILDDLFPKRVNRKYLKENLF